MQISLEKLQPETVKVHVYWWAQVSPESRQQPKSNLFGLLYLLLITGAGMTYFTEDSMIQQQPVVIDTLQEPAAYPLSKDWCNQS